jgi:hypothetical protein
VNERLCENFRLACLGIAVAGVHERQRLPRVESITLVVKVREMPHLKNALVAP